MGKLAYFFILRKENKVSTNKQRIQLYLEDEIVEQIEDYFKRLGYNNRQDFITEAIVDKITNEAVINDEVVKKLSKIIIVPIKASINNMADDIAKNYYKLAVEISLLNYVLANMLNIDREALGEIRRQAVKDVKEENGLISLVKAARKFDDEDEE